MEQNNVKKYRKKPIVIEAIQWTGKNDIEVEEFLGDKLIAYGDNLVYYMPQSEQYHSKIMYIETLEGQMIASVNDYIIKGIQGEFYPCKPDIFKETYELVK